MQTLNEYTGLKQEWFDGVLKLFPNQTSESLFLESKQITSDNFSEDIEGCMFSRMENLIEVFNEDYTTFKSLYDFLDYLENI